jgi:hypothetical protein
MTFRAIIILGTLLGSASAMAADIPDMKGTWRGKTQPIVAGKGGPHWPENGGTFDKPALLERDMTIRITGQDGRRFWGESIVGGDATAGSKDTAEPLIGSVSTSGENVMMADTDGYFIGELSGGTLSYCYLQAGAKTGNQPPAVATCLDVTRQP